MALNFKRFIGGIQLVGVSSSAVTLGGEVEFLTSTNKLNMHNGTTASPLVSEAHTATLTNKTLSGNTATNLISGSGTITFNTTGTITVPNATDTLVGKATSDVLTNKTLTGNTAVNLISGSGTLIFNTTGTITVPNGTDTLVGKATSDVLTNKSIDSDNNTLTNIVNANIKAAAGIVYSKLTLTNSILNADVNSAAAIAYSKLSLSGSVTNGDLAGSIAASKLVGSDIATVGTVTTGTWSATTIALNKGGTGQTTATAAFNALSPLTTKGDIIVRDSTNNIRVGIGSDGQVPVADSTQTSGLKWATLQQGAKNYITYNNFENNATTGWSLCHSSITSNAPVSVASATVAFDSTHGGTSATASLTFVTVSSGQLAGTYSGSLVSSGATTAGDMLISQAYTIDLEDQAKVMTGKFYYKAFSGSSNCNFSGTSSNSFAVWIYDVTNAAWIQPAGVYGMTQGSGVGYCTFTWQTPSNMSQFQVAIFFANATSGAATIYVDDFTVGPQTAPLGAIVTDWTAYTPTVGAGYGTPTLKDFYWARQGDSLLIKGDMTIGTVSGATGTISLPTGLTIDPTKLANVTIAGEFVTSTAGAPLGLVLANGKVSDGNTQVLTLGVQNSTTAGLSSRNVNAVLNTGDRFTFVTKPIPISGWSSTVQASNDTDTRVVAARYQISASTANSSLASGGAAELLDYDTKVIDTHGAVTTGASWKFTAPVSGYYRVSAVLYLIAVADQKALTVYVYKNGSVSTAIQRLYASGASDLIASGSAVVQLNAGDYVQIYAANSDTSNRNIDTGTASSNDVSIERISGPATVAMSEQIVAVYQTAAAQTLTTATTTTIDFGTKVIDTHGAVTTGASWKFTAPRSGFYDVKVHVSFASAAWTAGNYLEQSIRKNSTATAFLIKGIEASLTTYMSAQISTTVQLVAGDTIDYQIYQNSGGNRSLLNGATYNEITVRSRG
jgi:hypothetical protein